MAGMTVLMMWQVTWNIDVAYAAVITELVQLMWEWHVAGFDSVACLSQLGSTGADGPGHPDPLGDLV